MTEQPAQLPLTEEEIEIARVAADPVLWCESHLQDPERPDLPLTFRVYQKLMIRWQPTWEWSANDGKYIWKNRVKIYRCGRRIGKSVVTLAELIWLCSVNKNYRAMLITPYEQQMVTAFETLQNMCSKHVSAKFTRNPYKIQFSNGSIVHGLIAGVKSTKAVGRGSSARGEGANGIFVIEMDHGIDHALEAIVPIMAGKSDCRWVGDSTPSGQRGLMWKWEQLGVKEGYKVFHITSHKSPEWNAETEKLMRQMFPNPAVYNREVNAEYGEPTQGVYKADDLAEIAQDYTYDEIFKNIDKERKTYCYYAMGVDWNEVFGVKIYIVEYNPRKNSYRTVYKVEVPNKGYTQLHAVDEIVRLNEIWNPHWIYVDKGHGNTNTQHLHKYGDEHPDTGLKKKVKAIDFGSYVIINDAAVEGRHPATDKSQRQVKMKMKEYCVFNSASVVESQKITIPEEEDRKDGLIGQMRGYQQRETSAGNIVFEEEDRDDLLVAWMLALLAFNLEMGEFAKLHTVNTIKKVANPFHLRATGSDRLKDLTSKNDNGLLSKMGFSGLKVKRPKLWAPNSHWEEKPEPKITDRMERTMRRHGLDDRSF